MSNFQTLAPIVQGVPGTAPRVFIGVTSDNLGTLTGSGYLNDLGAKVKKNDVFWVNYSDTSTQPPGENSTLGLFYVTVSGSNFSLSAFPAGAPAAARILQAGFDNPDTNANLVTFDVTVGHAALASGGSVSLYPSSGSKQYIMRELWMNLGGVNFSGGSGDRNLQITDGTTVYSVIPTADLQTLVNAGWGSTPLPFPVSAPIYTETQAGAALVAKYQGGSADFTAGSIVLSGILERVA